MMINLFPGAASLEEKKETLEEGQHRLLFVILFWRCLLSSSHPPTHPHHICPTTRIPSLTLGSL